MASHLLVRLANLPCDPLLLIVQQVLDVVQVRFQRVPCVDAVLHCLILFRVLFGFPYHALDLLLRQSALIGKACWGR